MNFNAALIDALDRVTNREPGYGPEDEEFVAPYEILSAFNIPGAASFVPSAGEDSRWEEVVSESDFYEGERPVGIYDDGDKILVIVGVEMGHNCSIVELWSYSFRRVA